MASHWAAAQTADRRIDERAYAMLVHMIEMNPSSRKLPMRALTVVAAMSLLAAACGSSSSSSSTSAGSAAAKSQSSGHGTVSVLYAGSLVNLMEHDLGPAFSRVKGYAFEGVGAGSTELVAQ